MTKGKLFLFAFLVLLLPGFLKAEKKAETGIAIRRSKSVDFKITGEIDFDKIKGESFFFLE